MLQGHLNNPEGTPLRVVLVEQEGDRGLPPRDTNREFAPDTIRHVVPPSVHASQCLPRQVRVLLVEQGPHKVVVDVNFSLGMQSVHLRRSAQDPAAGASTHPLLRPAWR